MRRIAVTALLLAALGAAWVAVAGADDKRAYQAELFNGFGLVKGSELRVAGVTAGTITDLDVTPEKTALVSFEVGPGFPELKSDASCSSEPQSLIAEYFLDCQPGSSDQPLEGPIDAARNQTTVQNDLVQNTLREPFNRRFQLIINEFGTALVGNAENLNAAIRSGAPALREFRKVLKILGRQNQIIAGLNTDADTIFQKLADRREDVVSFIDKAEDTARISAERRVALAQDFDLLDDFLFELKPVMHELGNLAREQTPLLIDLRAAAPGLNKLAKNLPGFNDAARVSLISLGKASDVGGRALGKSSEEIEQLRVSSEKAQPAADIVAKFLVSLDDPAAAVEETCAARRDLREQPGEADRRVAILEQKLDTDLEGTRSCPAFDGAPFSEPGTGNPGYTGLEGLLNYVYTQTTALNLYDQVGHGLHINIVGALDASEGGGECGHVNAGPTYAKAAEFGAGRTDDPRQAVHCAALLGDNQPGITPGTVQPNGLATGLPPYDPSVCPDGSTRDAICPSAVPFALAAGLDQAQPGAAQPGAAAPDEGAAPDKGAATPALPGPKLPKVPKPPKLPGPVDELTPKEIRKALGLPPGTPLPPNIGALLGGAAPSTQPAPAAGQGIANDLMDFLFGP